MNKFLLFILLGFFSQVVFASSFDLPKPGDNVVGYVKIAQAQEDDDFSDIARRFDVGYYEMFEANPGVDPDNPRVNTILIVPTQYVLPPEIKPNRIVVNLAEMRLYYQPKNEKRIYIFPVGIGKEDWDTPLGEMTVIKKVKDPKWIAPDSIYNFRKSIGDPVERVVPAGPDNPLGKYELRLSRQTFLIHGTNLPDGVGRRSSAGCIRLYPEDIEQLYKMVDVGTSVLIINKPYKAGWLNNKLYLEAHMPLLEQRIEMGDDVKPALAVVEEANKDRKITIDWSKVTKIAQEHLTVPREI